MTRTTTMRSARALPLAALTAVLVAAGCGGTASPATAPAAQARPAAATSPATPATPTAAELAGRVSDALKGVSSGTATVTAGSQGRTIGTATISADTKALAGRAIATAQGKRYELRVVGGKAYASAPDLAPVSGGKPWVGVDLSTLVGLAGGSAAGASGATPSAMPDPARVAAALAGAVAVRDLGGSGYRVSLPLATVGSALQQAGVPLSAQQSQQLRAGVDALAKTGVTTLSADLNLDAAGRPVRFTTTTPAAPGGVPSVLVTVAFSGWGAPVSVAAPPAADVRVLTATDLQALGRQLMRSPATATPTS